VLQPGEDLRFLDEPSSQVRRVVHQVSLPAVSDGAVTNSATGLLNFTFGSTFRGDLANHGVIAVDGRTFFDKSNGQYTNYGQFVLSNHGTLSSTITNSGQFTNQGQFTVTNTAGFTIEDGSTFEQSAGVLDVGVANSGGTFTLDAGSTLNLSGGTLSINHQLFVKNGSTLDYTGGSLNLNGYLYLQNNSDLNLPNGTAFDINGSLQLIDGGTLNLTAGTLNVNGSISIDDTTFTLPAGLTLNLQGDISLTGSAGSSVFRLDGGTLNYSSGGILGIEYLGGTINGALPASIVTIGELATNPATFVFAGTPASLQGNVHEGQTLILQGTEGVNGPCFFSSNSFTNNGRIVLTSTSTTYAWLNVHDTLTNGPTGLLHVQVGSNAGQRNFSGNLVNYGTVQLDRRTNFMPDAPTRPFIENHGVFTIDEGVILANNSTGSRFDQIDGEFNLRGVYRQEATGALILRGGVLNVFATTDFDPDGSFTFDGGTMQLQDNFNFPAARSIAIEGAGGTIDTNGFNSTISSIVSGTGSLRKTGPGTVTLSGNNGYSGGTTLVGGTLSIANDSHIGGTTTPITFQSGMLRVTGTALTNLDSHVVNWSTFDGGFDIADAANTFTVSQDISGPGSLTKAGPGTLVLSGNNTYAGTTTINAGTLRTSGGNAIPDSSQVNLANVAGALLELDGTNETIGNLSGGGAAGGNVNVGAGILTVNQSAETTYAGATSGLGSFVKAGLGTLHLSGANALAGNFTVNRGIVAVTGGSTEVAELLVNRSGTAGVPSRFIVNGGSFTAGAPSVVTGWDTGTADPGQFLLLSGSAEFNGGLSTDQSFGHDGGLIRIEGGTFMASDVSIARNGGAAPDFNTGWVITGGDSVVGTAQLGSDDSTGTLSVEGGSLTVTGPLTIARQASAGRGGAMRITGGTFTSTDTVDGIVLSRQDEGGNANQVASATFSGGVSMVERFQLGYDTAVNAGSATLTVDGGTLYIGSGGIEVKGSGAFVAAVNLSGGTLGAKADWTGSPTVMLSPDSNSTIQAADSADGSHHITLNGNITGTGSLTKTGGGNLILGGSNTYVGTTNVQDGALLLNGTHTGGGDYTIAAGATFGGIGTVDAAIVNDGTIAPGLSPGMLHVGDYTQGAAGQLSIELASATSFDTLDVTGTAALGGTLDVSLINDFAPTLDDAFVILTAGSITGTFGNSVLPELAAGLAWQIDYGTTDLTLEVILLGDMDFDGNVDSDDTDDFVLGLRDAAAYQALYGVGPQFGGDLDMDGDLDFDDIDDLVVLLQGQPLASSHAVAEPNSLALVALALVGLLGLRARGKPCVAFAGSQQYSSRTHGCFLDP
jgi:autotransporter-associated beta strand protein